MANYLYVDNSNVWIEGMHVAAVPRGLAPDLNTALSRHICDHEWKLDFGRLLRFAGGPREEIGRAVLYGSKPPPNDSLWAAAKAKGFEVVVHERSRWTNREKKVDTNISTDIVYDALIYTDPCNMLHDGSTRSVVVFDIEPAQREGPHGTDRDSVSRSCDVLPDVRGYCEPGNQPVPRGWAARSQRGVLQTL